MSDSEFSVLRSRSVLGLQLLLEEYSHRGWRPIGYTDFLRDEFVQPIKLIYELDDTEEITQRLF